MSAENRLPIPDSKGPKPFFQIEELLNREDETGRVECTFEEIQDFLQSRTQHVVPLMLAASLSQLERWQLIYPNTFDLSQILFIGRSIYPKKYIPIAEAEATIYFHRGAEDGAAATQKPYTNIWKMELAGLFPDSNGDPRLLAVYYRLHTEEGDFSSQGMRISIRNNELRGREEESDDIFGPVLKISNKGLSFKHPFTSLGEGVVTPGMLDMIPDQRRVVVAPFYGRTLVTIMSHGDIIDTSSPRNNQGLPKDRGIYKTHKSGVWEIGLDNEGSTTPWVLSVPDFLEEHKRSLNPGEKA